jgi:gas vesicle protein
MESHETSADEIANLLAQLQTDQPLGGLVDDATTTWNDVHRYWRGPRRKLIAQDCMTVAIHAEHLQDSLCINLVRLAHLLENKGDSTPDSHKRQIIDRWQNLKAEIKAGSRQVVQQQHQTIQKKLQKIESEMKLYVSKLQKKTGYHPVKPKNPHSHATHAIPQHQLYAPSLENTDEYLKWKMRHGQHVLLVNDLNINIAWKSNGVVWFRKQYYDTLYRDRQPHRYWGKMYDEENHLYLRGPEDNIDYFYIEKPHFAP